MPVCNPTWTPQLIVSIKSLFLGAIHILSTFCMMGYQGIPQQMDRKSLLRKWLPGVSARGPLTENVGPGANLRWSSLRGYNPWTQPSITALTDQITLILKLYLTFMTAV